MVIKAMKNGMGEWAVFYGSEKATHLAYARFFRNQATAERWAQKFRENLANPSYKSKRVLNHA